MTVAALGQEYRAHLDLLVTRTDFPNQCDRLGTANQRLYSDVLGSIEARRSELRQLGTIRTAHDSAAVKLRSCFSPIKERAFSKPANLEAWLSYTHDPEAVEEAFMQSWKRLELFFLKTDTQYVMRWNSIKSNKTALNKIQAALQNGHELDLWDMVRFRTSLSSPRLLSLMGQEIVKFFGDDVCRVRNYYAFPRGSDTDSYRALHFEILAGKTFFELQANTVARDLIGLLDHDFTATKRVPFLDDAHRQWLEDLRMAANVYDASLL